MLVLAHSVFRQVQGAPMSPMEARSMELAYYGTAVKAWLWLMKLHGLRQEQDETDVNREGAGMWWRRAFELA